jgi:PII-like signaling protein
MKGIAGTRTLMRVFIKESDHYQGKPLYLELLRLFKEAGLAGGTALRGIAGFGAHAELHTDRILRLTQNLPVVVEVVDDEAAIRRVLPTVGAMLESGLVTLERAEVISYSHPKQRRDG